MFKLIIVGALSMGLMAFVHSTNDQGKSGKSDKGSKGNNAKSSPNIVPPQKGNNGGGKLIGGSEDKGGQSNGKQNKTFNLKPSKGNNQGGGKPHSSNQKGNAKHGNDKHGKQHNGNHPSGKGGNNKAYKGKGGNKHYAKGHPNFGYVYVNNHGYYSHKNYGQWRSQQAKMKHKKYHPVYELQAIEGFRLIVTRNVFLFNETDYKINLLRVRLDEKRKANTITLAQHGIYLQRIAVLQKRRAALEVNIVL